MGYMHCVWVCVGVFLGVYVCGCVCVGGGGGHQEAQSVGHWKAGVGVDHAKLSQHASQSPALCAGLTM
jgi:hypothetical protein